GESKSRRSTPAIATSFGRNTRYRRMAAATPAACARSPQKPPALGRLERRPTRVRVEVAQRLRPPGDSNVNQRRQTATQTTAPARVHAQSRVAPPIRPSTECSEPGPPVPATEPRSDRLLSLPQAQRRHSRSGSTREPASASAR